MAALPSPTLALRTCRESRESALSIEKQRFAGAESSNLNKVPAPSFDQASRLYAHITRPRYSWCRRSLFRSQFRSCGVWTSAWNRPGEGPRCGNDQQFAIRIKFIGQFPALVTVVPNVVKANTFAFSVRRHLIKNACAIPIEIAAVTIVILVCQTLFTLAD